MLGVSLGYGCVDELDYSPVKGEYFGYSIFGGVRRFGGIEWREYTNHPRVPAVGGVTRAAG